MSNIINLESRRRKHDEIDHDLWRSAYGLPPLEEGESPTKHILEKAYSPVRWGAKEPVDYEQAYIDLSYAVLRVEARLNRVLEILQEITNESN